MTSQAVVSLDALSGEANTNSEGQIVIQGKGEFLGGGATGLVERLASGDVVKSPWPGPDMASDCRHEIAIEAQIYARLGAHPRLLQCKHWDPVNYVLTLEYMPHGTLKEYVQQHRQTISVSQRRQWVIEVVEAVEFLHSNNVVQADVGPHNFLLDSELSLRICDFAGSSLDGEKALVVPGVRYRMPSLDLGKATVKEDLFALGSTVYFIATGFEPYEELAEDEQVEKLYKEGVFPGLSGVPFEEVIALCWRGEAGSAEGILRLLRCMCEVEE